jgi:hypothetical protein
VPARVCELDDVILRVFVDVDMVVFVLAVVAGIVAEILSARHADRRPHYFFSLAFAFILT